MGLRILLCDDNRDLVDTLALLLNSEGHQTSVCYDGHTCISKAREWVPELGLIDIGLPDMTGYEVATAVRAMPFAGNVMLVAVTGYAEYDDVRRAKAAGFDLHMKKGTDPMLFVELAARLETR